MSQMVNRMSLASRISRPVAIVKGSLFWQTLLLVFMVLVLFGPVLNLLIWTVTESWFFPCAAQRMGIEILVSGLQPLQ